MGFLSHIETDLCVGRTIGTKNVRKIPVFRFGTAVAFPIDGVSWNLLFLDLPKLLPFSTYSILNYPQHRSLLQRTKPETQPPQVKSLFISRVSGFLYALNLAPVITPSLKLARNVGVPFSLEDSVGSSTCVQIHSGRIECRLLDHRNSGNDHRNL